ncbi:hypothetical protein [Pseudonocardia sp.]|uniref:hypothetical protein n=1 Tax=Pseudonocardia sp. TaxID=60912 RepID=UPI002603C977|nr:hypothetical protein [Pseudonocardia sp.]
MWTRVVAAAGSLLIVAGCTSGATGVPAGPDPVSVSDLVDAPCGALDDAQVAVLGYRTPGTSGPAPDGTRLECRWEGATGSVGVGASEGPLASGLGRAGRVGGLATLEIELVRTCVVHLTRPGGGSLVVRAEADADPCAPARATAAAVLETLSPTVQAPTPRVACDVLSTGTVDLVIGSPDDPGTPDGAGRCRWSGPAATVSVTLSGGTPGELAEDPGSRRALIGGREAVERVDGARCTLAFEAEPREQVEVEDGGADGRRACARARVAAADLLDG